MRVSSCAELPLQKCQQANSPTPSSSERMRAPEVSSLRVELRVELRVALRVAVRMSHVGMWKNWPVFYLRSSGFSSPQLVKPAPTMGAPLWTTHCCGPGSYGVANRHPEGGELEVARLAYPHSALPDRLFTAGPRCVALFHNSFASHPSRCQAMHDALVRDLRRTTHEGIERWTSTSLTVHTVSRVWSALVTWER